MGFLPLAASSTVHFTACGGAPTTPHPAPSINCKKCKTQPQLHKLHNVFPHTHYNHLCVWRNHNATTKALKHCWKHRHSADTPKAGHDELWHGETARTGKEGRTGGGCGVGRWVWGTGYGVLGTGMGVAVGFIFSAPRLWEETCPQLNQLRPGSPAPPHPTPLPSPVARTCDGGRSRHTTRPSGRGAKPLDAQGGHPAKRRWGEGFCVAWSHAHPPTPLSLHPPPSLVCACQPSPRFCLRIVPHGGGAELQTLQHMYVCDGNPSTGGHLIGERQAEMGNHYNEFL